MKRSVFALSSVTAVTTAALLVACGGDTVNALDLVANLDAGLDGTVADAHVETDGASTIDAGTTDATTACTATSCASGMVCVSGACVAPSCTDGVKDGDESDVDCGGSCGACSDGHACGQTSDCTSKVCTTGTCVAATCGDGMTDGNETGVDCGGSCPGCATGGACKGSTDCASLDCVSGACLAASCSDMIQNQGETDKDCGGPNCAACADTKACKIDLDCQDRVCANGVCSGASCTDHVENGTETGVDCGGASCGACAANQGCLQNSDCIDKVCTGDVCQAATCSDMTTNGNETDQDCGGGTCDGCPTGDVCKVDGDCITADTCTNGTCAPAVSCAAILTAHPTAASGAYAIEPAGVAAPFAAYCDMSGLGGGWTLVLKTSGATSGDTNTASFRFNDPLWTNTTLLPATPGTPDLTVADAKYPGYLSIPVTELRGQLDGYDFTLAITGTSAQNIMATVSTPVPAAPTTVTYPTSFPDVPDALNVENDPNFEAQPNCRVFGVNADFPYAHSRFGFTSNNEGDCSSNDSATGFGIEYTAGTGGALGSGFLCQAGPCTQGIGTTSVGTNRVGAAGYLWVK